MINDDFLLQNETAKTLYNSIKDLPIIDYHNHLDPKAIYENIPFQNISKLWLEGDHYKWRLMRFAGINESSNDALVRFANYTEAIEHAYLNPLYHWSHMELKTFFNVEDQITKSNALKIYDKANKYLSIKESGPRELLMDMKVEALCTTDDLCDDLKYHKLLAEDNSFNIKVLPTFRPDRLFTFNSNDFNQVIKDLNDTTNTDITNIDLMKSALIKRLYYFNKFGCMISDHGITHFIYHTVTQDEANDILTKRIKQNDISNVEIEKLNSFFWKFLLKEYEILGWTVQFHIGALRNTNTKKFNLLGRDAGYDSISEHCFVDDFNNYLDDASKDSELPRIIIYPLNVALYEAVATMCNNFSGDVPGKIQLGAAWWFHDHKTGIEKQLTVFAEYLHINYFIGMVTDSRSFLSFVRHDYFRRILANYFGEKVEKGLIPNNIKQLIVVLQNISYHNSKRFLNL